MSNASIDASFLRGSWRNPQYCWNIECPAEFCNYTPQETCANMEGCLLEHIKRDLLSL